MRATSRAEQPRSPSPSDAARIGVALAASLALLGAPALAASVRAQEGPTLDLDPSSGPPGTELTATASGFDDCPPVDGVDDPAVVEDDRPIDDLDPPVDDATASSQIEFRWDGDTRETGASGPGPVTITFDVPAEATAGEHTVTAVCAGDDGLFASRMFEVAAVAEPDDVTVPDVRDLTRDEAVSELAAAGLMLGQVAGDGDRVGGQDPEAGSAAAVGSSVDLIMQDLAVEQPDDEPGGQVPGADEQDPDEIDLEEADEVAAGATGRVRPAAWLPASLLLAAVAAALLALRSSRPRRDERWVRTRFRAAPCPATSDQVTIEEVPRGSPPTVRVRLEPRLDGGASQVEEVGS